MDKNIKASFDNSSGNSGETPDFVPNQSIVLVGLISPYAEDRAKAREAHEVPVQPHEGPVPFMEVSVFSEMNFYKENN